MAAQPAAGSCTRITFGGTSGTVVSTTMASPTESLMSLRVPAWAE
jgi:hypothetical protein